MQNHTPNSTVVVTTMLREHPLGFPLGLVLTGAFLMTVVKLNADLGGGLMFLGAAALGVTLLCAGAVMLPFGVIMAIRRKTHKVTLVCPACGYQSSDSATPFRIERPGSLDYAVATCPQCNWVFESDKYATLV